MYQVSAKITMNGKFGYMTQTSLAHVWVAGVGTTRSAGDPLRTENMNDKVAITGL